MSDGLADKLESDDKEALQTALSDALKWLEDNQEAATADYEEKRSAVEDIVKPIISKAYSAGSSEDSTGSSEDPSKGPEPEIEIEEVPEEAQ